MESSRGISSFSLKVAAIACMTCNHAAHLFPDMLPFPALGLLEGIGGLTFPIMAFLLAEGWRHTSDIRRYEMRLAVFAGVSQIPYGLFLGLELNVLFTLLIGLLLLHFHTSAGWSARWWAAVAVGSAASLACDWGFVGVLMVLVCGLAPTRRQQALYCGALPAAGFGIPALLQVVAGNAAAVGALLYAAGNIAAGGLLCFYDGRRGRPMKWFFYAYYPAHIAVLGLARGILLGIW